LFCNTKISDINGESGKVPRMLAAFLDFIPHYYIFSQTKSILEGDNVFKIKMQIEHALLWMRSTK
jgi:hypothetical protein